MICGSKLLAARRVGLGMECVLPAARAPAGCIPGFSRRFFPRASGRRGFLGGPTCWVLCVACQLRRRARGLRAVQQQTEHEHSSAKVLVLEGCGKEEVNGIYLRHGECHGRHEWRKPKAAICWNVDQSRMWGIYIARRDLRCRVGHSSRQTIACPTGGWILEGGFEFEPPKITEAEWQPFSAVVLADDSRLKQLMQSNDCFGWEPTIGEYSGRLGFVERQRSAGTVIVQFDSANFELHPLAILPAPLSTQELNTPVIALTNSGFAGMDGRYYCVKIQNGRPKWEKGEEREKCSICWDGAKWGLFESQDLRLVSNCKSTGCPVRGWADVDGGNANPRFVGEQPGSFYEGDAVQVLPNIEEVRCIQNGHNSGWNQSMAKYCGQHGFVESATEERLRVRFDTGRLWSYSPRAVLKTPEGQHDLMSAVIEVKNSGHGLMDGVFMRKGLHNGRPQWVNLDGPGGFGILWDDDCKCWGIHSRRRSPEDKVFISNCNTRGCPRDGWRHVDGDKPLQLTLTGRNDVVPLPASSNSSAERQLLQKLAEDGGMEFLKVMKAWKDDQSGRARRKSQSAEEAMTC